MRDITICDDCGERPVMHGSWRSGVETRRCCFCHVKSGRPPADWHDECMRAWNEMNPWVLPDQYENPFPEYAAATDSEEWGMNDAESWIRECNPSKAEIIEVFNDNELQYTGKYTHSDYHDGVGYILGWHMPAPELNFSPGGINRYIPRTRWQQMD